MTDKGAVKFDGVTKEEAKKNRRNLVGCFGLCVVLAIIFVIICYAFGIT